MTEEEFIHKELTYKIIGCAMKVHTELGYGFLEKVYENSLMLLLHKEKVVGKQQFPIPVYFQGARVGEYAADIFIEEGVIIEIKTVERLIAAHYAQLLNYLKATNTKLGLILNFGPRKLEYDRLIL